MCGESDAARKERRIGDRGMELLRLLQLGPSTSLFRLELRYLNLSDDAAELLAKYVRLNEKLEIFAVESYISPTLLQGGEQSLDRRHSGFALSPTLRPHSWLPGRQGVLQGRHLLSPSSSSSGPAKGGSSALASTPKFDMFISHHLTPVSTQVGKQIQAAATTRGLRAFLDVNEGHLDLRTLMDKVRNSKSLVVILTEHVWERSWVIAEVYTALSLAFPSFRSRWRRRSTTLTRQSVGSLTSKRAWTATRGACFWTWALTPPAPLSSCRAPCPTSWPSRSTPTRARACPMPPSTTSSTPCWEPSL